MLKEYIMCDRKKRCKGCKKVLPISAFSTYKKKDGEEGVNGFCKKCRYTRDSKTAFKHNVALESYISRTMYHITRKDY